MVRLTHRSEWAGQGQNEPPSLEDDLKFIAGRKVAVDVLYDGKDLEVIELEKVKTNNTHGTGCTLASAIAAYLAKGLGPILGHTSGQGHTSHKPLLPALICRSGMACNSL